MRVAPKYTECTHSYIVLKCDEKNTAKNFCAMKQDATVHDAQPRAARVHVRVEMSVFAKPKKKKENKKMGTEKAHVFLTTSHSGESNLLRFQSGM